MNASDRQINGDHYKDFAIQPGEFIHRNGLNWCEGNVIKYVCRHARKHGRQDLEKAIHYLQLLIEWQYGEIPASNGLGPIAAFVSNGGDPGVLGPCAGIADGDE